MPPGSGLATTTGLGVGLLVGLGDERAAVETSLGAVLARRAEQAVEP